MNTIVVVDKNWGIGYDGDQLVYIHADLKRFKELTTGHPVIYGRKTLATFPKGAPLKGRRNLLLSKTADGIPGAEIFRDIPSLLQVAPDDSFVIGGASIYKALLSYCDKVFVTKVDAAYDADAFFPNLDSQDDWAVEEEGPVMEEVSEDGIPIRYKYVSYRRKS